MPGKGQNRRALVRCQMEGGQGLLVAVIQWRSAFGGVDAVPGMSARHFLAEVLELLRMQLPLEMKDFEGVGP